jgi:ATP-dependent metalloprotease
VAFILVTAVGAFLDDKSGLGKSLMSNPDLKPQFNSSTKFADVMGARARSAQRTAPGPGLKPGSASSLARSA